jgi:hypothetical protein
VLRDALSSSTYELVKSTVLPELLYSSMYSTSVDSTELYMISVTTISLAARAVPAARMSPKERKFFSWSHPNYLTRIRFRERVTLPHSTAQK